MAQIWGHGAVKESFAKISHRIFKIILKEKPTCRLRRKSPKEVGKTLLRTGVTRGFPPSLAVCQTLPETGFCVPFYNDDNFPFSKIICIFFELEWTELHEV